MYGNQEKILGQKVNVEFFTVDPYSVGTGVPWPQRRLSSMSLSSTSCPQRRLSSMSHRGGGYKIKNVCTIQHS